MRPALYTTLAFSRAGIFGRGIGLAALTLSVAACGARAASPAVPGTPGAPALIDAPAGDAEATCARHPVFAEESTFFRSATIEDFDSLDVPSNGDLWPSCSEGGRLYAAWGDGFGFDAGRSGKRSAIGVGSLDGTPADGATLRGKNLAHDTGDAQSLFRVWTRGPYYQKPTGILCHGDEIDLAVQDLDAETYDDAPAATIAASTDGGVSWREGKAPMFPGAVFTTIMFLDYGAGADAAAGPYVYAYGLDHNWRSSDHVIDPQGLYLARIAAGHDLLDRAAWEFYAGADAAERPLWTRDIGEKKAVLVDCTRRQATRASRGSSVISQGGVVYDAPLRRYIYTSWTEYTFEFYEAPAPWGPWRRFLSKDFGPPPWTERHNGGYATSIPSRFISADGRTLWVQSNTWSHGPDHNDLALRKLVVVPQP